MCYVDVIIIEWCKKKLLFFAKITLKSKKLLFLVTIEQISSLTSNLHKHRSIKMSRCMTSTPENRTKYEFVVVDDITINAPPVKRT
jgi:hypothetical protein